MLHEVITPYLLNQSILVSYFYRQSTELPGQLKETCHFFLRLGGAEGEAENGQSHLEQDLGTFKEEHVPHS